jgi:hypothetical protein
MTDRRSSGSASAWPGGLGWRFGGFAVAALLLAAAPALAQSFPWPWSNEPERPPVPREPVYRPPPQPSPPPSAQPAPGWGGTVTKSNICLQLEQRLVQEGQRGNQARDQLPKIEAEIRAADRTAETSQAQLERQDCYEYFLFSKSLRRTRQCVDLANQVETAKRRVGELEVQRQQIMGSSGRSYQDDIIRELARNNCGATYAQEARRRDAGPFSSIWQDDEGGGGGAGGQFGALPFATYRTLCVRLCDGYYFPVSFSTLPNHFQRDAEACQSKCAAPAELYYHQNPGGSVDQMVALNSQEPYTKLKSAFRYRKELVQGCSCKQAEFVPQTPIPAAPGAPGSGPPPDKRAEAAPPPASPSPRRP